MEEWRDCFEREGAEDDLRLALRGSELVKWQFRGVAQTGLMVPRNYPGRDRKPEDKCKWSTETIFRVLEAARAGSSAAGGSIPPGQSDFLDADEPTHFSTRATFRLAASRAAGGLAIFLSDLRQYN